ncbi:serine/arginine repetitive matrix protein 2 [Dermacentor silvarum]|uniref:serine/arginine repetitive matrix protein 2 n=1 Tax=Dermacentor silvarum TaxID=543639 RepID=UPI0021019CBD|nr:serine/arginine repetitive matrix protein 2 [Dermacentor silvarum]
MDAVRLPESRASSSGNSTVAGKASPSQQSTAVVGASTRRRATRRPEAGGTSTFWRRRPLLQRSQTCLGDVDRKAKKKSSASSSDRCPGGGSEDYWFLEPANAPSTVVTPDGASASGAGIVVEERAQAGDRKLRSADRNSKGGSCLFLSQCCCQTKGQQRSECSPHFSPSRSAAPTSPSISCGSSSSKNAAENQRFSNSGSKSSPQPPPHQSQASGSSSASASSAIHSESGSKASKTADEAAASAAASAAEACGDDAGDVQYCDPWDTGPAAVALRLLRADEQRNKSPTPAHATPAAGGALSADEMARQRHIYETAFDSRVKQRDPDQDLDRMAQSPVLLAGLQQQPRAGPLYPVPSSSSSSGVSVTPGRKGGITRQPSLQDACCPKPPPHQGSSSSTSASSSVQQQPAPTPRGSSSSGGGNPSVPIPATRGQGLASKQASAADKAIYQNHPLPQSPISENPPAAPLGAVAVKRSIHAGVKVLPSEPVRRPRHGGHRKEGEPMALAPVLLNGFRSTSSDNVSSSSSSDNSPRRPDEKRGRHGPLQPVAANSSHVASTAAALQNGSNCALQSFRASPSVDSLSNSSCDSPRKPEEKRGRLVAVAPPTVVNGAPFKGISSTSAEIDNAERRLSDNSKRYPAARPLLTHNQSPSSDSRPESDYDRPWDLPRIKRSNGDSPPQVPDHRSRPAVQSPTQHTPAVPPSAVRLPPPSPECTAPQASELCRASPAPTASSSSGGGPSSSSPSVAMMASSSSSSSNTSIAMESPAAGPPARPSAPARPMLNLNLNLNASNSPKRSRHNLTLNFGCAALSVVGEKVDTSVALEKQGWYHGSISRLDAENLLRVLKEGSYLVRNSESSKHDFSLSLKSARGFMHMKIVHNEDGKFILGQFSKPFESIPEMIHHYSVNKLPIKGAEHMSLLYPVIDQLL